MSVVNRFNVNNTPVTLDADIIENMSANDVSYDGSLQYNENTIGSKLSELESKTDHQGIYDVSAHNNGAVFESLSSLLNHTNLSTLIPVSVRCGGMSIRFIQGSVPNSNNKYVQYRLMSDNWSVDTKDWAITGEDIYIENSEFVYVKTDAEGKILWAIRTNGDIFYGAGIPSQVINYINEKIAELSLDEYEDIVAFLNDLEKGDKTLQTLLDEKVDKVTGKGLIQNEVSESLSAIEDPERRSEITTDSEGKIISYRDSEGVVHENVGIESAVVNIDTLNANHINVSDEGLSELAKELRSVNLISNDWSEEKELHIEEPYCARVNFTNIDDIPQAKFLNVHGIMEFWDMHGNYFKKEVIMNAQGSSSMNYPKKNIAIDICNNNNWDDNDTFKLQIGSWVPQDSFHLKAYYTDPFRCMGAIGYKLYNQIVRTRGEIYNYVWKRALLNIASITYNSNGASATDETKEQYSTGATCFPDGFPCIVYLNGEFYGLYSWQIKKHRDNYHMDKSNKKHIHLDGHLSGFFLANGDNSLIDWTDFEVRNPKNLICMDGSKYDGDNPAELIDETSPEYDSTNSKHVNTAFVKAAIINLTKVKTTLADAITTYNESSKTTSDLQALKDVYETYLDPMNTEDYIIFSDISMNDDGFGKNWQWFTYDGVKWFIGVYDLDCTFGNTPNANQEFWEPYTTHARNSEFFKVLYDYYTNELNSRYASLRNNGIISLSNIISYVSNWLDRVGNKKAFDKEWKKWSGYIKNDSILRLEKWIEKSIQNMDIVYNYNPI